MRLIAKTLSGISSALEIIMEVHDTRFNPSILIISSFLLTAGASFCSNIFVCIIILTCMLMLPPIIGINAGKFYRLAVVTFIMLLIISIPAAIYYNDLEKVSFYVLHLRILEQHFVIPRAFVFLIKTFTAFLTLEVFIAYMGWRNMYEGLLGLKLPRKVVMMILFFIMYLPIFLREMSMRLLARSSRIYRCGVRRMWFVLSTIVSDIIVNSIQLSRVRALGLIARGFTIEHESTTRRKISLLDILLLILCILVVTLLVV